MARSRLDGKIGDKKGVENKPISASVRPFVKAKGVPDAVQQRATGSGDEVRRVMEGRDKSSWAAKLALLTSLLVSVPKTVKAQEPPPEDCSKDTTPRGETIRAGTCILGIQTANTEVVTRLEDAMVIIDRATDDVTVSYGAVRVLAGNGQQPTFTARRGEKFIRFNISKDSTLWVEDTGRSTKVTAETTEGQTGVMVYEDPSQEFTQIINAGDFESYTLTDDNGSTCSTVALTEGPIQETDLKLMWLGILNGFGLLLRRRRRAQGGAAE